MILKTDKAYKDTKLIKRGVKSIKPEFRSLADWISQEYDVHVLNLIYYTVNANKGIRPFLQVCLDRSRERAVFSKDYVNDPLKEQAIVRQFSKEMKAAGLSAGNSLFPFLRKKGYETSNLGVSFSAFQDVAMAEANERVSQAEIDTLVTELNCPDLWLATGAGKYTTFFLYTDEQLKRYEFSDEHRKWSNAYFDVLERHDEFGYFTRENYTVLLDSKENFDTRYESNWYYYYK